MIAYAAFAALRLHDFLDGSQIAALDDWEFMEQRWVGEAFGFTEFLRLRRSPRVLRSLSLDLLTFPPDQTERLLALLDLPVASGMRQEQLDRLLGEPVRTVQLVADRVSVEYVTGGREPYEVSCTVRDDLGLTYVVVSRPGRFRALRSRMTRGRQVPATGS